MRRPIGSSQQLRRDRQSEKGKRRTEGERDKGKREIEKGGEKEREKRREAEKISRFPRRRFERTSTCYVLARFVIARLTANRRGRHAIRGVGARETPPSGSSYTKSEPNAAKRDELMD